MIPKLSLACIEPDYEKLAKEACDAYPNQVKGYKIGKGTLGFFVGMIMKVTRGAANPSKVSEALRKELDSR
jgi:aspartyl-tRNA(Asn)/glutamyl-tRNA(Gln) amidotransferase subunit B